MTAQVHLIVTCLKPELLDSALLVFKSLRTGFPTAKVNVYANALPGYALDRLEAIVGRFGVISELISHDSWIERLLEVNSEPFWICDTDIVFFDSVEDFTAPLFGGRFEPSFEDEWTKTTHMACLHPSLMYFNPVALRCTFREWRGEHIPRFFPNLISNFIRQQMVPHNGKVLFWDTCAGLHHAFEGTRFSDEMNAKFEHLHCGTVADSISKEVPSLSNLIDRSEERRVGKECRL